MARPGMTYLKAAIAVLHTSERPMTAREITADAIRRGLVQPSGKTPEATMAADLYLHVRDSAALRIVRVYEQGPTRARRGSVRWALAGSAGTS